MSRAIVLILACAFLLGPFGLGSGSAWTDHHGKPPSHHDADTGDGDRHQSPEGLITCGPSVCAPAVTPATGGPRAIFRTAQQLSWGFFDDRAIWSTPGKQDPPVPRLGA